MQKITIKAGAMTLAQLRTVQRNPVHLSLDKSCYQAIEDSYRAVCDVVDENRTVYGVNTGFGLLANTKIDATDLSLLQHSVIFSSATGTGVLMGESTVRLMMTLKANSLARGFSGVRLCIIENLIALINAEIYPCIPEKGSVGASGDLAPLAHMGALLLGEGEAMHKGKIMPAKNALSQAGLSPLELGPKEGLAIINGTQASTALALEGLFAVEDLYAAGTVIGSLSVEAALGSRKPFDERVHAVRGHPTQIEAARAYLHVLEDSSEIGQSHANCDKVQDPYSLRCQPQVMGACLHQIRQAADVLLIEANAVSDNPLVFSDTGDFISAGNFHAEPVAMIADNMALAIAEIASLSERRMALLIDTHLSGLPSFLVDNGGVNCGFMVAQVTGAALTSENKALAHPASVDSIPTSANQEDHVSMATFAARRLRDMADNTAGVLAIEYLAACQGIDYRAPLKTSKILETVKAELRSQVPFFDKDRFFAPDIAKAKAIITNDTMKSAMPPYLLPSMV